jgi:DNA-binding Xre family transcriptional regulator
MKQIASILYHSLANTVNSNHSNSCINNLWTKKIGECSLNTLEKIAKALKYKVKDLFEEERDE